LAVTLTAFGGIFALLFSFFRPALLLLDTNATGGDTGAHIYGPWYMKTELLPRGLLAGWSPDWYAGFPLYYFYFPLVSIFQALLGYVIPYEVSFKIGTVIGTFFLPLAVFTLFRLLRFRYPVPLIGAIFSLGFLFMHNFSIYGGNIASSLAGEYSFALSLGLCLVFLGLAYRLSVESEGRPFLAGGVLALAVLSHLVPVIIASLFTPVLFFWAVRAHGVRSAITRLGTAFAVAFGLTAVWSIPFLARLSYAANMRWQPIEGFGNVLPRPLWFYLAAGTGGAGVALLRRERRVLVLLLPAGFGLLLYFFLPQGYVWNGRFLPFWYLGICLAAAYFVGTATASIRRFVTNRKFEVTAASLVGAVLASMVGWVLWDKRKSYVDEWINWNYEGYERKASYPEFQALMTRVRELPPGRVMWEPSPELGTFGTPVSLMALPYFAGRPSMEGIYYESSITTPFHFLTAAEVAARPSNPIPDLPYSRFDLDRGIRHMSLFDVRYYITVSGAARHAAIRRKLPVVADVGRFSIFRISSPGPVIVPKYQPVVVDGDWTESGVKWFSSMDDLDVPLAASGPLGWARVHSFREELPRKPLPHGGTSIPAKQAFNEIAFTTNAVGEPHWVKTSYFPNWRAEGALGPYRASPSLMLVVPTQRRVRLLFKRTWAEWTGSLLTVASLTFLVLAASRSFGDRNPQGTAWRKWASRLGDVRRGRIETGPFGGTVESRGLTRSIALQPPAHAEESP
jgi:hypothetical protein